LARALLRRCSVTRTRTMYRGFTLVELMVVVAIIGVLSVLAVVGYRKILNSSKVAEATNMVQAIRVAQESYHAETGAYAKVSGTLNDTLCPAFSTGQRATWDPTCNGGSLKWSTLPVHSDGALQFKYATVAGTAADALPAVPSGMQTPPSFGTAAPTTDWFAISARGDVDGNGINCTVVTTSWNNGVYVDREGE
jgi:prepilin-type N-terminal cleavage/methylation domain-containing protein